MMVHLSTCVGFFLSLSMTVGVVGPVLAWLGAHRRDAFLVQHAREALNFHLTVLLLGLALINLPTPPTVMAVIVVVWITLVVAMGGMAYEGRAAWYPGALPILRRPRGFRSS